MKNLDYYMSLNYDIKIHKFSDEEGGGFQASIPQLGESTFVADGDTVEEAISNLEKLKKEIFSLLLKQGKKIEEPKKEEESTYSGKFVVRVPIELHKKLSEQAESQGMSLNSYLIYLLTDNLNLDIMKNYLTNIQTTFDEIISKYHLDDSKFRKNMRLVNDYNFSSQYYKGA